MIKKPKICFLLSSEISHDPRVQKEANSAILANYNVAVICYYYKPAKLNPELFSRKTKIKIKRGFFIQPLLLSVRITIFWYKLYVVKCKITASIIRRTSYIRNYFTRFRQSFFYTPIQKKSYSNNEISESVVSLPDHKITENVKTEKFENRLFSSIKSLWRWLLKKLWQLEQTLIFFVYYSRMMKYHVREGIKFEPNIIHANDLDTLLAGYLIKRKTGAKLVYDAHEIWTRQGLDLPKLLIFIFGFIEKILIRKVDAFISVNESLIEEIEKINHYTIKTVKVAILNCPKRPKSVEAKAIGNNIQVLYQGGCFPNRGIEELCLAARYLPGKVKIIIRALGDQQIINRVEEIRQNYHLKNKIIIAEPVAPAQLVESARSADIGVIANQPNNINNYLVLPNKIFEYMAAGLAIAASDFPEMRKIINKYHNGALFNPTSPKSIARTIRKLVNNKKNLFKMKNNSLAAIQYYNWEIEEKKLLKIYSQMV